MGFATLNPGDTIKGGSGVDGLYIGQGGGAQNFADADITGIEKVYAVDEIDVSKNADVVEVQGSGEVKAVLAQNVILTGSVNAKANFLDSYGAADEANVTLNYLKSTGGTPNLTVNGVEKLTLDLIGSNPDGLFTANKLENLVVEGNGWLSADASGLGAAGTIESIDASGNSGGVRLSDITFANLDDEVTIKGGEGKDKFTFNANTGSKKLTVDLGKGDDYFGVHTGVHKKTVIDAGEGQDTLEINNVTSIDSETGQQYKGFETIAMKGTSEYKAGYIEGVTSVTLLDGTDTVFDLNQIRVQGVIAKFTSNIEGKLNLTFDNGKHIPSNGAKLTLLDTKAEDVFIHSNGTVLTTNHNEAILEDGKGVDNMTFTIDGDQAFDFKTGALAKTGVEIDATKATGNISVDISTMTKAIKVKGSKTAENTFVDQAGTDTITSTWIGGDNKDSYTFKDGGAVVTLGKGADKVIVAATSDASDKLTLKFGKEDSVLSGEGWSEDTNDTVAVGNVTANATITFDTKVAGDGFADDTFTNHAFETLEAAGFEMGLSVAKKSFHVYQDNDTASTFYLYQDTNGDSEVSEGDFIIQLTGIDNGDKIGVNGDGNVVITGV